MSRLFSPFLQLSPFAIEREQGTGLGLSITKNIVERMQGKIGAISAENVGSTFWVNHPCTNYKPPSQANSDINVAIVIANAISRRAFKKQLIYLGHQVYSYASISSCSGADFNIFDVIFIDDTLVSQQNLSPFTNAFINAKTQHKIVMLIRRNQATPFLPNISKLDLPCRSNYLSTFIMSLSGMASFSGTDKIYPAIIPSVNPSSILIADDNEINRLQIGRASCRERV